MSLKNPVVRQLVRMLLAGMFEDAKKVYEMLLWRWGENFYDAAKHLWENRRLPGYGTVGGEEISSKAIDTLYKYVSQSNTVPVTMREVFAALKNTMNATVANLGIEKQNLIESISKRFFPKADNKYLASVRSRLLKNNEAVTEQELYDELNTSLKEANYMYFYDSRKLSEKKEEQMSKPTKLRMTQPRDPNYVGPEQVEQTYSKFSNDSSGISCVKVAMMYIDSLES
jgi:hypothetical protein